MKVYGLIGNPLSHSFSQKFFSEKFEKAGIEDCVYKLFPLEKVSDIIRLLKEEKDLAGLNVTIPYKEKIIPYLNSVEKDAAYVGAVNVIKITHDRFGDQRLKGYNSDFFGFQETMKALNVHEHERALVLGTGGAAKAIHYGLGNLRIEHTGVSREPGENRIGYEEVTPEVIASHRLIVNCTPIGMHPNENECPPLPYEAVTGDHILYDLVYNPEETLFMKKGLERGATVKNGLDMLHRQAEKAWEIWNSE